MTQSQDRALLHFEHASAIYGSERATILGSYIWKHPREAWAAMSEMLPWEGLALSLIGAAALWRLYGPDLGASLGACLALALCVFQLLRTKSFATSTEIVQQRGLFVLSRRSTPLAGLTRGRVVRLEGSKRVGDVVLETASGELRLRSLSDPEMVLERLIGLRDAVKESRVQ